MWCEDVEQVQAAKKVQMYNSFARFFRRFWFSCHIPLLPIFASDHGTMELLQSIVEPLSKEYATVERYFTPERNRYFASLRSNISLAQGVKQKMRLIDQNEVEWMATGL